jgi:2-oxo-4-hydroxy-4-carboxy-5-ureidoimidazoline decarboxylase
MHKGIGLAAFNAMPMRRAVHAVYECCYSVPLAADFANGRPYDDYDALFRQADGLLFGLSEDSIDSILQAYPCAVRDERPEVLDQLGVAAKRYLEHFGFGFVMFGSGHDALGVLATMTDRLLNDTDTERKVVRNELARINRSRLERMLGPEGGYDNW